MRFKDETVVLTPAGEMQRELSNDASASKLPWFAARSFPQISLAAQTARIQLEATDVVNDNDTEHVRLEEGNTVDAARR
jgi:hypothetical protein